ncbi:hypothetical protein [Kushneria indalinina]|uniref:Uncharacterized protein n=1 Tax=Kushneria indalinina DSM 14324 TaxID=1122140 RepID=A0A3D9DVY4_9GAMM|nr:hypothetical protein [Kushneria indalinina]REC94906.1 hypothetical protein C8D72_1735 [Kushneria indalinina DSM 14324]
MASVHAIRPETVDPRAGFLAARDELRRRTENRDLAEVWAAMQPAERAVVLRSAAQHLVPLRPINEIPANERTPDRIADNLTRTPIEWMSPQAREAIRSAIHRMSSYASRLRDGLRSESHPSQALAASARLALEAGDIAAAQHYLKLIEDLSE